MEPKTTIKGIRLTLVDGDWRRPESPYHRWSGWPGAFCLDCGQDDGMELALADGAYDPCTDTWTDEETKQRYLREYPALCPAKGRPEE